MNLSIHTTPTPKSRVFQSPKTKKYFLLNYEGNSTGHSIPVSVMLTSEEEIKEGDYVYNPSCEYAYRAKFKLIENLKQNPESEVRKVIAHYPDFEGITPILETDLPYLIERLNYGKVDVEVEQEVGYIGMNDNFISFHFFGHTRLLSGDCHPTTGSVNEPD